MRLASMVLMVVVLALLTLGECGRKKNAVGRVNKITQYMPTRAEHMTEEQKVEERKQRKRERDRLWRQKQRSAKSQEEKEQENEQDRLRMQKQAGHLSSSSASRAMR